MTPEQRQILTAAVTQAKAQGITDTNALLIHLTERKQVGSHEVQTQVTKDATQLHLEQAHDALLQKYGMSAGVDKITAALTMQAAVAGKTGDALTQVGLDQTAMAFTYETLLSMGCAFDANEGVSPITVTTTVPDYGEPIISFGINGNDIEAVQK